MIRALTVALVGLLPAGPAKNWLLRRLGWQVAPDARIGPCLFLRIRTVSIGAGAHVGPFNVVRDLDTFDVGAGAIIGQWNWISAAAPLVHSVGGPHVGRFMLGEHAGFTSRHYVDASGGVEIGAFAQMAGVRSTVITHGIDMVQSRQTVRGCSIGHHAVIGSNVKLVPGAHVPDESLVAMGSVVTPGLQEPSVLYRGVPATRAKDLPKGRFASRPRGPVDAPLPYDEVESPARSGP
jgi:carbonic anhydrase/acetyltransferase-like protein (isoleucine patch superfamily)